MVYLAFDLSSFTPYVPYVKPWSVLQLQLSVDVEVVFARGTLTPEQQKKVPLIQTEDEEHTVDGEDVECY